MKKHFAKFLFAALAVMVLSSCNRGYGCPTNFSLNDFFSGLIEAAANLLF